MLREPCRPAARQLWRRLPGVVLAERLAWAARAAAPGDEIDRLRSVSPAAPSRPPCSATPEPKNGRRDVSEAV